MRDVAATILELAGVAAIVAAAWTVSTTIGMFAAGVAALIVGVVLELR